MFVLIGRVTVPDMVDNPRLVINSNGDIFWYKRMHLKTSCGGSYNYTSTCEIVIGSNLLNDAIIDFDHNKSSCDSENMVASPSLEVSISGSEKREEERWLKENATFPEFICKLQVTKIMPTRTDSLITNVSSDIISSISSTVCVLALASYLSLTSFSV